LTTSYCGVIHSLKSQGGGSRSQVDNNGPQQPHVPTPQILCNTTAGCEAEGGAGIQKKINIEKSAEPRLEQGSTECNRFSGKPGRILAIAWYLQPLPDTRPSFSGANPFQGFALLFLETTQY